LVAASRSGGGGRDGNDLVDCGAGNDTLNAASGPNAIVS